MADIHFKKDSNISYHNLFYYVIWVSEILSVFFSTSFTLNQITFGKLSLDDFANIDSSCLGVKDFCATGCFWRLT